MASRDLQGPSRSIKVLSRDDRDDRDRDRNNRRDRDRDRRRREEKDRERKKEQENSRLIPGVTKILKRPDSKPSSAAAGGNSSDRVGDQTNSTSGSSDAPYRPAPTSILQRSVRKDDGSGDQAEKNKCNSSTLTDILKGPYKFPGGKAMKLIDSTMKICPWKNFDYDANNYAGNMDYLVITTFGRPNVGKSSILSYLAGDDKFGVRKLFPPRSQEEEMQSSIYITSDQIILIELSSIFNLAATSELIPLVAQQGVLEVSNVTWNLRLVRWALAVSDIVLIVSENVFEPSLFQLMCSAEIIHPMVSALGEGSYPELIYVCNKANLELVDNEKVAHEFQRHFTSVTGRIPRIASNYFILPHKKYETEYYRFEDFKQSILEFNRYNRAPFAPEKEGLVKLAQKVNIQEWFLNSTKMWDEMNLPNYFSSYVKLLP